MNTDIDEKIDDFYFGTKILKPNYSYNCYYLPIKRIKIGTRMHYYPMREGFHYLDKYIKKRLRKKIKRYLRSVSKYAECYYLPMVTEHGAIMTMAHTNGLARIPNTDLATLYLLPRVRVSDDCTHVRCYWIVKLVYCLNHMGHNPVWEEVALLIKDWLHHRREDKPFFPCERGDPIMDGDYNVHRFLDFNHYEAVAQHRMMEKIGSDIMAAEYATA